MLYRFANNCATAHEIRNTSTKKFQAVYNLTAQHRWCVSGTPIQNSVRDIGALFKFLRYQPLGSKQTFKKEIVEPLAESSYEGYIKLRTALQHLCLRRLKTSISGLLPPKKQYIRKLEFSEDQRILYDRVKNELIKGTPGAPKGATTTTFQMVMKLRQICNHGEELLSVSSNGISGSKPNQEICCRQCSRMIASCFEEIEALGVPRCSQHSLCENCAEEDAQLCEDVIQDADCQACITLQFGFESNQQFGMYRGPSVKVKALLSTIGKDRLLTTRKGGPVKQ